MNRVTQQQPDISEAEWTNHFQAVLGTEPTCAQPVATDEADPHSVGALDGPITQEEIARAIGHPKDNKSPGTDGLLAEMLKNSLS